MSNKTLMYLSENIVKQISGKTLVLLVWLILRGLRSLQRSNFVVYDEPIVSVMEQQMCLREDDSVVVFWTTSFLLK